MICDELNAPLIRGMLTAEVTQGLGDIHVIARLDSTNTWVLQNAQCGDVCIAEQQTAGRGRRGKVWESPAGTNVYLSLRWCFETMPANLPMLSLVTGVAVAEALRDCGVEGHGVKWPNDIVVRRGNQLQKLGGILLEAVALSPQVVIGIGVNVNRLPTTASAIDQPWSSLRACMGWKFNRNQVIAAILTRLLPRLRVFSRLDMAQFQRHWQHWDVLQGHPVRVLAGGEVTEGIVRGVDSQGQLQLAVKAGVVKAFSSADVSVRM